MADELWLCAHISWVVIPLWLLYDSYSYITQALRNPSAYAKRVANEEARSIKVKSK